MRNMIRKWLGLPTYHEDGSGPGAPIEARDVLHGSELAMVAYRIDNGYLLRIGTTIGTQPALIYCTDEKDMAEKIIVHRAKQKIDPRYGANPNKFTVAASAIYNP